MLDYTPQGMLELTKALVRIPSVSHSAGENLAADAIYALLAAEPYFQEHPDFLRSIPVEPDEPERGGPGRRAVLAFVRAGRGTARTVILNGHFDVVDTDVCGDLAGAAFDADEYTRLIAGRDIPAEARADLESGRWLFGRGVMDMKSGLALHMACLAQMAREPEKLGVNLLFLAVPDEEGNSVGMRGALPALCAFGREQGLDFIAALSGEPAFWTSRPAVRPSRRESEQTAGETRQAAQENAPSAASDGTEEGTRIFFTGTTGKIMPLFFCVGREAHAGFSFAGVNAAALAAQTVCLMDCHPDLMDGQGDDTLAPPVCLKMKDLRDVYSVTLPERAAAYFNVLTVSRSPRDILDICRGIAHEALEAVLSRIGEAGRRFQERSGQAASPVPAWEPRVLSFDELLHAVEGRTPEQVRDDLRAFAASLPAAMDEREKGIALTDRLVSLANLKGPAIVVGFLPPYYPSRLNRRATDKERRLRGIMEELCAELDSRIGHVTLVECFSGIMDLSFMGFQGEADELEALADNMPGWGTLFSLPMDDLLSLDVPIASMGTSGKDAHKDTERLELDYSFTIAPRLLETLLARLAEDGPMQKGGSAPAGEGAG